MTNDEGRRNDEAQIRNNVFHAVFGIRHLGFTSFVICHSTLMSITYLEAIREAQAKLLRDDERVFIYGQDVGGTFGGAFKATKGLAKEFPGRVLNTPISEDAMVGTAIGAAIEGMRPIVEMQFADFSSIALNQILNNAGHALLADECADPHNGSSAFRWNKRQRAVPQSIDGINLRALSGAHCHDAGDSGRRVHDAHRSGGHR